MTTQKQIRAAFWDQNPKFKRIGATKQNDYCTDIRVSFCDFLDSLRRDEQINEALANRATL